MGGIIDVHEPMYKNNIKKKEAKRLWVTTLLSQNWKSRIFLDTQIRITVYFLTTKE